VTVTAPDGVYYDPHDVQINADPYLAFRGLREEAPLYYNEQHDFYALSRFADVDRAIVDHETFSSARGAIIDLIKANVDIPDLSSATLSRRPPCVAGRQCRRFSVEPNTNQEMR
jgi:hypothetical protein